jgi:hypothetical protein
MLSLYWNEIQTVEMRPILRCIPYHRHRWTEILTELTMSNELFPGNQDKALATVGSDFLKL